MEAPIEGEGRWVAAEPGLQRRKAGGHSEEVGDIEGGESKRGKDLGGVRTMPVRSLEAGAFKMEVWVEEGKGKFQSSVEEGD